MPTQREFDALQQQVRTLSRELAIRPIRVPSRGGSASAAPQAQWIIQISDAGQVLYPAPAIRGINNSGVSLTVLPSLAPVDGNTYPTGLGAGYLVNVDGTLGSLVWVANQPVYVNPSTVYPGMTVPLPKNTSISSILKVDIPYTGGAGALASVYLPFLS